MTAQVWTAQAVRALGVRTNLVTAASVLGLGRTAAHEHARRGTFPVPVLRLGTRYVVPVAPLLELLGIPENDANPEPRDHLVTTPPLTCDDSTPSGYPIPGIGA